MIRIMILLSLAVVSIPACEDEILPDDSALIQTLDNEEPSEKKTHSNKIELAFSIAFGLPYVVAVSVDQSRDLVVEAVYQATGLTGAAQYGRIVNTGTLVVKNDNVRYLPTPNDRLVVKLDGYTHEFVIKEAQGDNQAATSTSWLLAPHILRYVHRIPGLAEVEIAERLDGARFSGEIKGWYRYRENRFDLNLTASGGSTGVRDYDGQDTQTKYGIKGKVTGGGLEVLVDERHALEIASATSLRLLYSMRGSATRFNATLNNTLNYGGNEYKLQNIQVQTDSKTKGGMSSFAMTRLEGKVLKDGKPFGHCVLLNGQGVLKTSSGSVALKLPVPEDKGADREKK